MSLLEFVQPAASKLPQVVPPARPHPFRRRAFYTALSLFLYLIGSNLPILGARMPGADPRQSMRAILASSRGTLMDMGVSPLVTAGLVMQGLIGFHLVNPKAEPRKALNDAQRLLAVILCLAEANV